MKILFLSFYFEPDLSAGSFRNTSLFRKLVDKISDRDFIHVITTKPNRYKSYDVECNSEEFGKNYKISRISVPQHNSGIFDQASTFYVYYKKVLSLIKTDKYDLVYASSSRLFTAFLGKRCSVINKCPLYLDIRDIFVDSIKDYYKNKPFIQIPSVWILKLIEKYTFKNACHINLVSEGFKPYFNIYENPSYSFYTNAIDEIFLKKNNKSVRLGGNKPYIITYAGNIGSGQGLEKVIPQMAKKLGSDYFFKIIGDGSTKQMLVDKLVQDNVNNVVILPPVSREELIDIYNNSTFLFFHLNDTEVEKRVLPSKMFEYGAFDKPIIAGVSGYASVFVKNYLTNYILFEPSDVNDAVNQLVNYEIHFETRQAFIDKFSRSSINSKMTDSILSILL